MKQPTMNTHGQTAALYCRLSRDDNLDTESNSISNHDVIYKGRIYPSFTITS